MEICTCGHRIAEHHDSTGHCRAQGDDKRRCTCQAYDEPGDEDP